MSARQAAGDFFEHGGKGLQSSALREANRRAVLTYIFLEPGSSMADISRLTGLAPQTASAILVELEDEMLVKRGTPLRGRRGQPATPLFLDPEGVFCIGVELGWQHLELVLMDLCANVLARSRRSFPFPDANTVATEIAEAANRLKGHLSVEQQGRLVGLGIAIPSALERNLLTLGAPLEQIALWNATNLVGSIKAQTQLPTECYSAGNAAAWAELVSYPAPRPRSFAYLYINSFVDGGIVSQSAIWEGPTGGGACFGSMLVDAGDGKLVSAHEIISVTALARDLRSKGLLVPEGDPADWSWADWADELSPWIDKAARASATVIFNAIAAVGCDHIIIDGVLPTEIMARLVEATEQALMAIPAGEFTHPSISQGHLGRSASAIGAAELPMFRRYFSRDALI